MPARAFTPRGKTKMEERVPPGLAGFVLMMLLILNNGDGSH